MYICSVYMCVCLFGCMFNILTCVYVFVYVCFYVDVYVCGFAYVCVFV